jgi:hypothetical protein
MFKDFYGSKASRIVEHELYFRNYTEFEEVDDKNLVNLLVKYFQYFYWSIPQSSKHSDKLKCLVLINMLQILAYSHFLSMAIRMELPILPLFSNK